MKGLNFFIICSRIMFITFFTYLEFEQHDDEPEMIAFATASVDPKQGSCNVEFTVLDRAHFHH